MAHFLENKYTRWYFDIIYFAQVRKKIEGYFEKHHIIPKSLGGDNSKENLVKLTAREHFICHWLLTKMVVSAKHKYQMWNAFSCMLYRSNSNQYRYKINSKIFDNIKKEGAKIKSEKFSGKNNPMYGKRGPLNPNYKRKWSDEHRKNASESHKGLVRTAESRVKQSQSMRGRKQTTEHIEKRKLVGSNNPRFGYKMTSEEIMRRTETLKKNKLKKRILKILDEGMLTVHNKKNANITRLANGTHPSQQKKKCPYCGKTFSLGMFKRWHGTNCKLFQGELKFQS